MNSTMIMRVNQLQASIRRSDRQTALHILNGQAMAEQFAANGLMTEGDEYVPFNEAMCANETCEDVFGDDFIQLRAAGHSVSVEDYTNTVLRPLKPLFERRHDCIVLWFGDDMFCQMNLLTLLAYLKQSRNNAQLIVHQVNETTGEMEAVELPDADYEQFYQAVLIRHSLPSSPVDAVLQQGMERYLAYKKPENEITAFIKEHADLSQRELVGQLLRQFPQYGLGDTQYIALIDAVHRGSDGSAGEGGKQDSID